MRRPGGLSSMFITDVLIDHATTIAKAAGAAALFVPSNRISSEQLTRLRGEFPGHVVPVVPAGQVDPSGDSPRLRIPDAPLTRMSTAKLVVFLALAKKL